MKNEQNRNQQTEYQRIEEKRKQRERLKTGGILLLSVLLVVSMILNWKHEAYWPTDDDKSLNFIQGVPDSIAWEHMDRYRGTFTFRKKARGVWYDTSDVANYLRYKFPYITGQFDKLPKDCKWVLGFYFMRKVDPESGHTHIPKLDFYVVPTIYDTAKHVLYDFSDTTYRKYYARLNRNKFSGGTDTTGYDAGHLWP